jgi:hypothetical protein
MVYDVPPFSTDMGEFTPSELEIPAFFGIESTAVEHYTEYIAAERIGGRVQYVIPWSLGCWR